MIIVLSKTIYMYSSIVIEFQKEKDPLQEPVTGVKKEVLLKVGEVVSTPPPDFEIHQLLEKILAGRKKMIAENSVDFALGEAFAFGSLLEVNIINLVIQFEDIMCFLNSIRLFNKA